MSRNNVKRNLRSFLRTIESLRRGNHIDKQAEEALRNEAARLADAAAQA